MTRRYFAAGLIALLVSGCGGGTSADSPPTDFFGTWKLTRIRGGVGGIDQAPDYLETITFRTDNTATIQHNNDPAITGPFQSKREVTDLQPLPLLVLTLPGGAKRAIISESATTLTLSEFNVTDRQIFEYTRQTN